MMGYQSGVVAGDLTIFDFHRDAADHIVDRIEPVEAGAEAVSSTVARGTVIDIEVQPGLRASGHDLVWIGDGFSESEVARSFHCGILLAGQSEALQVSGHAPVRYGLNRAVIASFGDTQLCGRPWRAGTRSRGAGFTMTPAFLDRFGDAVDGDGMAILQDYLRPGFRAAELTPSARILEIAAQILDNGYSGRMAHLFAEANALSLLLETTTLLQEKVRLVQQLGRWHYARVCEAREIVDASLANPPSTIDLARQVGVNVTTLQANFKAAYGTTIFGYIRVQRLRIARVLILERRLGIAEAGYRVGFTNAAAFSAAYRKYFGQAPSQDMR